MAGVKNSYALLADFACWLYDGVDFGAFGQDDLSAQIFLRLHIPFKVRYDWHMISINQEQKKKLHALSSQYALNFIALFGSNAQECSRKESDIDIAVSTKEKLDYTHEFLLQKELSKLLRESDIDLVQVSQASPLLMFNIAFKSQMLHEETKHSFAYFQMYAFKRYVEAKPLYALQKTLLENYDR